MNAWEEYHTLMQLAQCVMPCLKEDMQWQSHQTASFTRHHCSLRHLWGMGKGKESSTSCRNSVLPMYVPFSALVSLLPFLLRGTSASCDAASIAPSAVLSTSVSLSPADHEGWLIAVLTLQTLEGGRRCHFRSKRIYLQRTVREFESNLLQAHQHSLDARA